MDYNPAYGANLPDPSVILPEEIYQSDYEQVSSVVSSRQTTLAQSVEKSRNKELMEDPRLEEKKSRCRGVLVCFAMFVVCIILALLVAFTALLIFEILANRTLMAELDEVKQNSETSTGNQEILEERVNEILSYVAPEGTFFNPAGSCKDITTNTSGYYWIRNRTSITPVQVYCDFNRNCSCNATGVWMRVAELNMTNSSQQCPEGFRLDTSKTSLRLCTRNQVPGCTSLIFDTYDIEYSQICGSVNGIQRGSPDAFDGRFRMINQSYVDGVSITRGRLSRQHVWTFAAARDETFASCPCTRPDLEFRGFIPPFVGSDYFCETGSRDEFQFDMLYFEDPLWDGKGCANNSSCCSFNNPPQFCKELPQPTTDFIELRVCTTEETRGDEDILLEFFGLYIS